MSIKKRSRILRLPHPRNSRGATLIEALVAILLSAVGLLALAGANVAAVRYSKMSQYRGTATMLAADLAERMRANASGVLSYTLATNFAGQAIPPAASTACETYTNTCTAANMAAYDLATWRLLVRSQLPEGSVRIDAITTTAADVWLAWRDPAVAVPAENATDARSLANLECPPNFSVDQSVRCTYFRINL